MLRLSRRNHAARSWMHRSRCCQPVQAEKEVANGETDVRRGQRDFAPEELGRLLDAARQGVKVIRCLPGIDRHFLYLTACATGFRVSELARMTPGNFNLDGDSPTATVQPHAPRTASWLCNRCRLTWPPRCFVACREARRSFALA